MELRETDRETFEERMLRNTAEGGSGWVPLARAARSEEKQRGRTSGGVGGENPNPTHQWNRVPFSASFAI